MNTETAAEFGRRHRYLGLAVVAIVALTISCFVPLCVAPLVLPHSGSGDQVMVCVGLVTVGRTQVGIWWQSIFMSRMMLAALSPYAACATIPWSPSLPPFGELAFPP